MAAMKDDSRLRLSEKALLRYHVVSQVKARVLAGQPISAAIRQIASLTQVDPHGEEVPISERSVYRWLSDYDASGLAGLEDKPRDPGPVSKVLEPRFLDFLEAKKRQDPESSLPDLIRIARLEGVLAPDQVLCRTTVWRAATRLGLPLRRSKKLRDTDMRRFAYANRMLMVLCDGKHFRAGVKRLRRVALFFLDDATRRGLKAWVGTSESTRLFLAGVHQLIVRHGLMAALYLDRGPGLHLSRHQEGPGPARGPFHPWTRPLPRGPRQGGEIQSHAQGPAPAHHGRQSGDRSRPSGPHPATQPLPRPRLQPDPAREPRPTNAC